MRQVEQVGEAGNRGVEQNSRGNCHHSFDQKLPSKGDQGREGPERVSHDRVQRSMLAADGGNGVGGFEHIGAPPQIHAVRGEIVGHHPVTRFNQRANQLRQL